jgi:alpha-amylase
MFTPRLMKPVQFAFAVHNHLPIGNFDSVFEDAFECSYRPFIEVLQPHPGVKFTAHWSGPLLEWLLKHHPDFIERVRMMIERAQCELLTGAYFEAVLAVIPECYRQGFRKLTECLHRHFGDTPRGMWLAERVWEQPLAASLALAGIDFVIVDDTHFRHAGLRDEQLLGYYVTEELGESLKLVPVETVSLSEFGFERLYQNSVLFPSWKSRLEESFQLQTAQTVST